MTGNDTPRRHPTLKDVAAKAGVSLKTASRVVNGVASVDPQMTERVRGACEALGYRRHAAAADLRGGVSSTIGMVIRDMTNPFYGAIAAGAMEVAGEQGLLVLAASSEGRADDESRLIEQLLDRRPAGMIITPADVDVVPTAVQQYRDIPFVSIDTTWSCTPLDAVTLDNDGGMRSLIDAAVAADHRVFALIVDDFQLHTMYQRREVARSALASHGVTLPLDMEIVGAHTIEDGAQAMNAILGTGPIPDAVICGNNRIAVGAASAIVSADLGTTVVSFDEFPLADALPVDVISAVYDPRTLGREAVHLIRSRLEDPDAAPRRVLIPTTLIHHYSRGRR